jgi:OHS family lactose permease-like MFS transporter
MITSNKNYFISCLFFLFFFIGWGCCYPYLSLWLTETIGINYTDVGLVYSLPPLLPFAFSHYSVSSPTNWSIVKI